MSAWHFTLNMYKISIYHIPVLLENIPIPVNVIFVLVSQAETHELILHSLYITHLTFKSWTNLACTILKNIHNPTFPITSTVIILVQTVEHLAWITVIVCLNPCLWVWFGFFLGNRAWKKIWVQITYWEMTPSNTHRELQKWEKVTKMKISKCVLLRRLPQLATGFWLYWWNCGRHQPVLLAMLGRGVGPLYIFLRPTQGLLHNFQAHVQIENVGFC